MELNKLFIDSDKLVAVAEQLGGWKVSVLSFADWHVWFGVSVQKYLGKLILEHVSEDTSGQLAHHGHPFLSQFDHS
ncbi:MAG: hypothetical protein ACKO96_45850 [Flammeovirgaceae bacterium]